jgi:glycerol-3-phosphate acyltransferase PlsY
MVFPILSFFISKAVLVTFIGSVLALFFFTDLVRILNKRVNKFFLKDIRKAFTIYKDKEEVRISSMTLFLFGCYLSFLLFDRNIAFTAVVFLIFGDMSAKILGLAYGRHKLFNKSLEGSLSHFMACVVLGYILHLYVNIPLLLIFAGAATATLIEVVPFNVDDNLSVPVVTGVILTIGIHLVK